MRGGFATAPEWRGLEGFGPCMGCDRCITMCPAQALDPTLPYPRSYSRAKCLARRAELADRQLFCHNCMAVCPAGRLDDEVLLHMERVGSIWRGG